MNLLKIICLIFGIILVLLNIIVDIVNPDSVNSSDDRAYNIGYFIGSHIFIIVGIIFLRISYVLHKKALKKKRRIIQGVN